MHPLPAPPWEEEGGGKISESLCWGVGGQKFSFILVVGGILLRGVKFVGDGGGGGPVILK